MSVVAPSGITLQINICAGDLAYAEQIVPALVRTHCAAVQEVLLVADGCRPQSTPRLHAGRRFPAAEFARQLAGLTEMCERLKSAGVVDRVVWLTPDPVVLRKLNEKYAGLPTSRSHDHLGHAFSAYFLGWDAAKTRYVAHFDADIVLWQQPGFSWLAAAIDGLAADPTVLAVSPRIAPPPRDGSMVRVSADGSGWQPTWPLLRVAAGWKSPWFSTRCHLMDRSRLAAALPLCSARGPHAEKRAARLDRWLTPLYERGVPANGRSRALRSLSHRIPPYPLPPEVLLHESAQSRGFACLYLDDPRAWFIHPDVKSEVFLRLLPRLLKTAGEQGQCPPAQHGVSGVRFADWEAFGS